MYIYNQDGMSRSRAVGATGGAAGVAAADTTFSTRTRWGVAFTTGQTSKSFGSLFVHRLPASWKWFDSKLMEETIT